MVSHQLPPDPGIEGHHVDLEGPRRLDDRLGRQGPAQKGCIGGAVAEHFDRHPLRRIDGAEGACRHSMGFQDRHHEHLKACPGRPDHHPPSLQIADGADARIPLGDKHGDQGGQGANRPHLIAAFRLPAGAAQTGKVADGRVAHPQLEIPAGQTPDIFLAALASLDLNLPVVGPAVEVEHLGDGPAHHRKGASHRSRPQAEETALLPLLTGPCPQAHRHQQTARQPTFCSLPHEDFRNRTRFPASFQIADPDVITPSEPRPHFSPGGVTMAQDFCLQRVLASEERSGHYGRGSMCALKGKRQARARPAQSVP